VHYRNENWKMKINECLYKNFMRCIVLVITESPFIWCSLAQRHSSVVMIMKDPDAQLHLLPDRCFMAQDIMHKQPLLFLQDLWRSWGCSLVHCMIPFHLQRRVEGTEKREADIREVSRDELEFLLDHELWFNALNTSLIWNFTDGTVRAGGTLLLVSSPSQEKTCRGGSKVNTQAGRKA